MEYIYIYIYIYCSTNRHHFPCFHTVIETRVEVRKPAGRVFSRYFEFSQTSTSVSITYGTRKKNVFYFFYRLTRRKLKRENCILFFLPICVVSTSVYTIMFPISYVLNKNHDKKDNSVCYYKDKKDNNVCNMVSLSYIIYRIHTQFTNIKLFQS